MSGLKKPKFLEEIELPKSYYEVPNPYCDAPSNGISLLKLSRYAHTKNKKITDMSAKEVLQFKK